MRQRALTLVLSQTQLVQNIFQDAIPASEAEKKVLEIYLSKFSHCTIMDLRLGSELSLSLDQALQDEILHEVFDHMDNAYITDDVHDFLSNFFNTDRSQQAWCDAVRGIIINDADSELVKDTKEFLKRHLGICK